MRRRGENDRSGVAFLEEISGFVRSRAPVPRIPSEFGRQDPKTSEGTQGPQPAETRLLVVPAAFLNAFEKLFSGQWTA